MCGIAGIIPLDKNLINEQDTKHLESMLHSMIHRGPDGEGTKRFNECIFGMKRLAIIDIEGGQQPISNETDTVWVVMNGEIYNYVELREQLLKKGHKFKTHSDTEVIVHLYEEYGQEFVHHLNGMFAICVYDSRIDEIFLFRDRLGIKPLFYTEIKGRFIFSSDLNGLSKVTNASISRKNIASYLWLSYIPKPDTIYDNIHKLMPSCAVKIDKNRKSYFYSYWKIPTKINASTTLSEAKQELEKLLLESCSIQLRTETDFAISLSGGIDSSTVLAFASAGYTKKLNTISMCYEGKDKAEDATYARLAADKFKTNHIEVNVKREQFVDYLDEILPLIDEPISDSAFIPTYIIAKEARKRGIKVLLSGAGGDELFGGYHRHWKPAMFSSLGLVRYPSLVRKLGYTMLNALKIDKNNLRLLHPNLSFASAINGLNYSLLTEICKNEVREAQLNTVLNHYNDIDLNASDYSYNKMRHDAWNYLIDNILSLNDKATMAASVEGRFPFLDHHLVEFAFTLPLEINLYQQQQKGLLKEVLSTYLPHSILKRKKEGFNAPIHTWFDSSGKNDMRAQITSVVEEYLSDIIDIDKINHSFYNKYRNNNISENLYNLYFLSKWLSARLK